jgi:hypothetical protein
MDQRPFERLGHRPAAFFFMVAQGSQGIERGQAFLAGVPALESDPPHIASVMPH